MHQQPWGRGCLLYTSGHGVGTLDVGVVETFYLHGQAVQVQLLLYFFQQAHGPLLRIKLFGLLQAVGFVLLHIEAVSYTHLSVVRASVCFLFGKIGE